MKLKIPSYKTPIINQFHLMRCRIGVNCSIKTVWIIITEYTSINKPYLIIQYPCMKMIMYIEFYVEFEIWNLSFIIHYYR